MGELRAQKRRAQRPVGSRDRQRRPRRAELLGAGELVARPDSGVEAGVAGPEIRQVVGPGVFELVARPCAARDRKSTRLNSSHTVISYAVFCLKKKKKE